MTKIVIGGQLDVTVVNPRAAVNPDACDTRVRVFDTFTQDLHDLAGGFKSCRVTSVAMESTGVCWIPAFEILEGHGFDVILVNARNAKTVPGRNTDVGDAVWLRHLHSHGFLRGSLWPEAEVAPLCAHLRQRERLVDSVGAMLEFGLRGLIKRRWFWRDRCWGPRR